MTQNALTAPKEDPFGPPETPQDVECLHCSQRYPSSEMVYEFRHGMALWWCATPDCDGAGFLIDIYPVQ